ncbi:MAG: glycosyltransferase family 1 protein [Ignavibacteriales bacterium]|nr:MAG: glycosyltransferase family 1 protein [Ignavibacteriales bacterium]
MNIGIDARLLERKITGIGRYLILLLNNLPDFDSKNRYFLFTYEPLDYNRNFFTNIPTVKSFLPQKLFSPIWNNFVLPFFLKKNKMDIFFSVNQIIPLVKVKNCKYVSVVHDVIYKADKSFLPLIYRRYLQLFAHFSVKSSDLIVTVSNYSKLDILKNYKIDESKIKVIYSATNKEFFPMNLSDQEKADVKKSLGLKGNLVLYVGMIENRKNIPGFLKIADEIFNRNKDVQFVLVGKIGYGGENLLEEILERKNVVYLQGIDDKTLKKLYNISSVFLFPSFYEGFGFPPLEAMQCGLPVLSSDNTSLKEIVGEGGMLLSPDNYKGFSDYIIKVITDKNFADDMIKKGFEQAKKFSIEKTTKEFVEIFNSFNKL